MRSEQSTVQPAGLAVVSDDARLPVGRALVATRDARGHEELLRALGRCGLQPIRTMTVAQSRELLLRDRFSVILCEETIADGNYREILQHVGGFATRMPVVVFSRVADWERYLVAMRAGAFDYIPDPCPAAEIEAVVSRALRVVPLFP